MRYAMMAYVVACAACSSTTVSQTPVRATIQLPELELIVANQQSASASVLKSDGVTMSHITVGNGPHEAMISPDGKIGVVSIYGAQQPGNQIAVIDMARDSVIRTIDLGDYRRPHGMGFFEGSRKLIATSEASSNVVIMDLQTGTVEVAIPTNARGSHMVAITEDGKHAFTANVADNSVTEIDVVGRKFVRKITVPPRPEGITVLPNGSEVWVGSNQTGAVSVISTVTGAITHTLPGMTFPYRLGASPDGKWVAVVDGNANKLRVASVAEHREIGAIELPEPRGVVIASDNRTAYVTLAAGSVAVVDLKDLAVLRTFAVQSSPDGVGTGLRAR